MYNQLNESENKMKFLILGDVHSKWNKANKIINHELKEGGTVICTGDLCNYKFDPQNKQKMMFVYGNHDGYKIVVDLKKKNKGLIPLFAGDIKKLDDGTVITGFPGVYSPYLFEKEEENKYFKKSELEKVCSIKDKIDILLTHEAPKGLISKEGKDLGNLYINQIIDALKPKIAFCGHHHQLKQNKYNGIPIVCLDFPHHSYLILETKDMSTKIVKAELTKKGYKYGWEE